MPTLDDPQNPYGSPQPYGLRFVSGLIVVCGITFISCCVLLLIGIYRVFETMPLMGIPVDANGRPLETEGYPMIFGALVGLVLSTTFGVTCLICLEIIRRNN